jgi:hypothetical protein
MDSEDEEETDEENPTKIIKVNDEYEVKNGFMGLKRDKILKLTTIMNEEEKLKNLFCIGEEMRVIKDTPLFKRLRYFPPILQIKHDSHNRMTTSMK